MKKLYFVFFLMLFNLTYRSQNNCEAEFVKDTLTVPGEKKVVEGEYIQTTLKNLSVVTLFKTKDNKFYLKLIVTENFYFNKVDVLEIRSGSKSYYAKDTQQYKINKTKGLYVIEIFKNYIATLKEDGITSIVFSKAETDYTRQDARQIKQISRCLYDAAFVKKINRP